MEKLIAGASELGVELGPEQVDSIRLYHRELVEWNARVNLTSVTDWREAREKHFLDSLTVSLALTDDMLDRGSFIDVGTGAGFPGMPLKIAFPSLRATLVDSTAKKTAFLDRLVKKLGLCVAIRTGRAETLAHDSELRGSFDFVLARALGSMAVLAELTLPFCRLGGLVVAQKAHGLDDELKQAEDAVGLMGGRVQDVIEVPGTQVTGTRRLAVLRKSGPTPDAYPRRPGIPKKRPL
ncbi:MAG: 16S rRNA (guanine(527)-N(7))-methyltransferase RsmG [SAR202 cluster bacterium]|nr:16S rRNA (guanine(527)-N(7))-methyltransferase RsmG [SAR202 cluster bacterium]